MTIDRGRMDWRQGEDGRSSVVVERREVYPLAVARGALARLPAMVREIPQVSSVVVITDRNVGDLLLEKTTHLLAATEMQVDALVVEAGEGSKSWMVAQHLLEMLCERKAKRRTVLVALGGGVVCDLTGFVASMFMRGLPYINVPTSLMAQLDAAIGGKTGIDFAGSKNLVGAFYHPAGVLVDPDLLVTLPPREIRSGLAEAIKVGILNPALFERLEALEQGAELDLDALTVIVREAIVSKVKLLQEDPFERSLERMLNLGHTVGHAVEAASGFSEFQHGEAVAIGIAVATAVSRGRGLCSESTQERILACVERCGLPIELPERLLKPCWEEIDVIRRVRNGRLNEVLPLNIGECSIVDDITRSEYFAAASGLSRRVAHRSAVR